MTDLHHLLVADIVNGILILGLLAPLVWLSSPARTAAHPLATVALLFLLYGVVTHAFGLWAQGLPGLDGLAFNWMGKIFAMVTGLLVLRLLNAPGSSEFGLTFGLKPGSLPFAVGLILLGVGLRCLAYYLSGATSSPPNLEELLYEMTLPGLAEEMWHRSILLGLLNRIFPPERRVLGARFGPGLILTSVAFGLEHGLSVTPGTLALAFNPFAFARAGATGFFIYGLLRERTGSVVPSIAAHNLTNVVSPIADFLRR